MKLNFLEDLCYYMLGKEDPTMLRDVALGGLDEGFETPTLYLLAGNYAQNNPFVADRLLQDLLKELKWRYLTTTDLGLYLAVSLVNRIVLEEIPLFEVMRFIFERVFSFWYPSLESETISYDSLELAKVYQDYRLLEDLKTASAEWGLSESDANLESSYQAELRTSLQYWLAHSRTAAQYRA